MRILIAHSFYRVAGGEDRYVRQQMELLGADHEVTLLSARNEDLSPGLATASRMVGTRSHRRSVEDEVRAFRPDVVHLHNPYPALGPSVHLAARSLRVALVVTVHNYRLRCPNGFLFTEGEICTRCTGGNHVNAVVHRCFPSRAQGAAYASALWVHRFVRRLERDVARYVTPSEHMHRTLAGWGIPAHKLVTVRNFTEVPESPQGSGRFGVYLGRLSSEKGIDVLLAALERAGDPEFRIVGDGPVEAELREAALRLGLRRTRFLGRVGAEEVSGVLAGALYLAIPSVWHENAPLAALEAMARGIPLLVSDKGGLPELAGEGRGVVTPAGDVAALAAGIEAMTAGDGIEQMGERARRYASEHLTPQAHKAALENVYSGLVEVRGIA